jgi:SAM-dependent methyltransferase
MNAGNLPNIAHAKGAQAALAAIHARSGSVFQALFFEGQHLTIAALGGVDLQPLVAANLVAVDGHEVSTQFRISKVYELFVVTDTPRYHGSDRVWYLLEDESLLFARHIPDCSGKRCLDIGSGSGVLALTAAQKGASSVVSIDILPRATHISTFNAALNGITKVEFVTTSIRSFKTAQPFDYVTFNPPFVPIPDATHYVLSGSGGRDGLALVHTFFEKFDMLVHPATAISVISMSPGDAQLSVLERLFLQRYYGKNVELVSTDVYGAVNPIDIAFAPFAKEKGFAPWRSWLGEHGYTHMHYLFINLSAAARFAYRRVRLSPALEDLPESGTWGAMYRVIQNSKDHA